MELRITLAFTVEGMGGVQHVRISIEVSTVWVSFTQLYYRSKDKLAWEKLVHLEARTSRANSI